MPVSPASRLLNSASCWDQCGLSGAPPVGPVRQETSKSLSSPAGRRKLGKGRAGKRRDCSRFWRGYSELGRSIIAWEGNPAMMFPCRIYSGYSAICTQVRQVELQCIICSYVGGSQTLEVSRLHTYVHYVLKTSDTWKNLFKDLLFFLPDTYVTSRYILGSITKYII